MLLVVLAGEFIVVRQVWTVTRPSLEWAMATVGGPGHCRRSGVVVVLRQGLELVVWLCFPLAVCVAGPRPLALRLHRLGAAVEAV